MPADLEGFLRFLSERGVSPPDATAGDIQAYLGRVGERGQAPTSRARRLSALKQYYGSCWPKI